MPDRLRYARLHEAIKAAILVALYRKQGFLAMDIEHLRQKATALAPNFVDDRDVALALQSLFEEDYIDMRTGAMDLAPGAASFVAGEDWPLDATGIAITETGQEFVSRQRKAKSYLGEFLRGDDDTADDAIEELYSQFQDFEPIRYRDPQAMVDLRGAPEALAGIVEHLGNLIRMVETNNQIIAARSVRVEEAVGELKTGMGVIQKSKLAVGKIEGLFMGALAYLATQFFNEPVGQAAQFTWGLIKATVQNLLT